MRAGEQTPDRFEGLRAKLEGMLSGLWACERASGQPDRLEGMRVRSQ